MLGGICVAACNTPEVSANPNGAKLSNDKSKNGDGDEANKAKLDDGNSATCEDKCEKGEKRCSSESSVAFEECVKASDGCMRWRHADDCEEGFSCDKSKDDGTCKEGCTNDSGCGASTEGETRCSSNGSTEETCTKVGSCFVFKTTRTDIPQECAGNVCSSGVRKTCVASRAGACTQHVLETNPCPSNGVCQGAGQCVASCTNACTLNAGRCTGARARETCTKASNGCTVWTAAQSCSPDETCTNGSCI